MINIERFQNSDTQAVIDIVLHFQNDGTRPFVTVEDQPDLLNINEEYFGSGGYFWTAKDGERLVGTIGLIKYPDNIGVMKKFFVYEEYQGNPHHLGQRLYNELLNFAQSIGIKILLLDTPKNTYRAHKFYEKAGFRQVKEEEFPIKFSRPYSESDFFMKEIRTVT